MILLVLLHQEAFVCRDNHAGWWGGGLLACGDRVGWEGGILFALCPLCIVFGNRAKSYQVLSWAYRW